MRSSALRLVALLVLATSLVGTTTGAVAAPQPPQPRHQRPGQVRAQQAQPKPPAEQKLTLQLRDMFVYRSELSPFDRLRVSAILARPTQGAQDPEGDGYTAGSTKRCNPLICVHYVTKGADAPRSSRWIRRTLRTMTTVWHHEVDRLGFRRPPRDGRRGGDSRFDVYLTDLGSRGLFGYCAPEHRVKGQRYAAYGYCVLDNDFARRQYDAAPNVSLKVTAAHEFFHAIQFGYDYRADPWLMESTAVWMEESYADSADDNRRYLPYGQVHSPGVPLDEYSDAGYAQYGNWAFWQFLTDRYGAGLVRRVWNQVDAAKGGPARASVPALSHVLDRVMHRKDALAAALTSFEVANLHPGRSYPEGRQWPRAHLHAEARMRNRHGRRTLVMHVDHLAARDMMLRPPAQGARRRLRVSVAGPRRRARVVLTVTRADGSIRHRALVLRRGTGRRTVDFSPGRVRSVVVTVVNTSQRYRCGRGTLLSCGGMPRDDGRRFAVTARVLTP